MKMQITTCLRNNMEIKLIFLFLVIFCFGIYGVESLEKGNLGKGRRLREDKIEYNRQFAYPNTYEAPTSADQINKSIYIPPLLSRALDEVDFSKEITKMEFMHTIKFSLYGMTYSEFEQIFVILDRENKEIIEYRDWEKFVTLYVSPFEACLEFEKEKKDEENENSKIGSLPNYSMTVDKLKICFDSNPKSKFIKFLRKDVDMDKKYKKMIDTVSSNGDSEINFYQYLFIRRAMYSWMHCHNHSKFIAKSHFNCAIKLLVKHKYLMKISLNTIYDTGLKYQNYINDDTSQKALDFIAFLRISYYTHVFTIFSSPQDSPYLEQKDFVKAVNEGRFPLKFEKSEVDVFFELTDVNTHSREENNSKGNAVLNFESFCFFFHMHRLFIKYSKAKPMLLNKSEFLSLLNDELSSLMIHQAIDSSFTNFQQSNYQEASLILQKKRVNEENFFFSFLQSNKNIYSHKKSSKENNQKNREVFFSIFTEKDKDHWNKKDFYRAFQLANLYIELSEISHDVEQVPSEIINNNIQKAYEKANPPVSQLQRRNFGFYKIFPKEISIDILTFLCVENFPIKIKEGKMHAKKINETKLKTILKDFGMENMPDTVIDLARKGYDRLRRRVYDSRKAAEYFLLTHAVAAEHMRTRHTVKIQKLKPNKEKSRQFPHINRRFKSSPLV